MPDRNGTDSGAFSFVDRGPHRGGGRAMAEVVPTVDYRRRFTLADDCVLLSKVESPGFNELLVAGEHRNSMRIDSSEVSVHHDRGGFVGVITPHTPRTENPNDLVEDQRMRKQLRHRQHFLVLCRCLTATTNMLHVTCRNGMGPLQLPIR